jgi:hypothetical protein
MAAATSEWVRTPALSRDARDAESSSRRISVESLSDDAGNFGRDSKASAAIIVVMRNARRRRSFRVAWRASEASASLPLL